MDQKMRRSAAGCRLLDVMLSLNCGLSAVVVTENLYEVRLDRIPGWGAVFKRLSLGASHT